MPQVAHPAVQFPMPYAKHGFANDTNRDKTSKYQNPGIQPRNKIFEAGNCLHYFGFCHGAPPRRSFDLRLYRCFYSYYWSCSISLARADPFGKDQAPWLALPNDQYWTRLFNPRAVGCPIGRVDYEHTRAPE